MKSISKKKYFILFFLLILIVSITIKLIPNNKTLSMQSGFVGFGLFDDSGSIIDNGDTIYLEELNKSFHIKLSQNLEKSREYSMIVFLDYEQIEFAIEDDYTKKYNFVLSDNDTLSKDIKFDINNKEAGELSILFIKKPSDRIKKNDFSSAMKSQNIYSLRYPIGNTSDRTIHFEKDFKQFKSEVKVDFFISKSYNDLKLITEIKENSEVKGIFSNETNNPLNYALIALNDWNQMELTNGKVSYYEIPPNTSIIADLKLPKSDSDSNIQYIAFPYPYNVSYDNIKSTQVIGSSKIHLKTSSDN